MQHTDIWAAMIVLLVGGLIIASLLIRIIMILKSIEDILNKESQDQK